MAKAKTPAPATIPDEVLATIRRSTMALVAFGLFAFMTLRQQYATMIMNDNILLPIVETEVGFAEFLVVGPIVLMSIWAYLQINLQRAWRQPIPTSAPRWPVLGLYAHPIPALMGWIVQTALVQVLLFAFAFKARIFPWGEGLFLLIFAGSFAIALLAVYRRWPDEPRPWLRRGWKNPLLRRGSLSVELFILPLCFFLAGPFLLPDTKDMAKAELSGINLIGMRMTGFNLRGANLSNTRLGHIVLEQVNLQEANLQGANLSKANLQQADLTKANLTEVDLQQADLRLADLRLADLTKAFLWKADLTKAKLQEADLTEADLTEADLTEAFLWKANLTKAIFHGAELQQAILQGADLTKANLQQADLFQADLQEAGLWKANLQKADLNGARLVRARNLTRSQLCDATFGETTVFPDGSKGHTQKEVCAEGVADDAFGLAPPA